MTIINPKSIAGVTSITTASGADNLLTVHTNNTTERVRINNDGDVIVGSGITVSPDGDIFATGVTTATTFSGSGASLTNLPAANITGTLPAISGANLTNLDASDLASGTVPTARLGSGTASSSTFLRGDSTFAAVTSTTINNNADNRIITGSGTADTLEGESTLTYDAGGMNIAGDTDRDGIKITQSGNNYGEFNFNSNRSSAGNALGVIRGEWNSSEVASIYLSAGDDTTNKDDGQIKFYTSAAGGSIASRMEVLNNGNVKVTDGDLVIGTSGHGIDFSATSGTGTSELFDDYEEGTFTPEWNSGSAASACYAGGVSYSSQVGVYRKVGHVVHFIIKLQVSSGTRKDGQLILLGLPFTSGDFSSYSAAGGAFVSYTTGYFSDTAHIPTAFVSPGQSYLSFFNTAGNNFAGSHLAAAAGRIDVNGHYFTS